MIAADKFEQPAYPSPEYCSYTISTLDADIYEGYERLFPPYVRASTSYSRSCTQPRFDMAGSRWPTIYTIAQDYVSREDMYACAHVCVVRCYKYACKCTRASLMRPRPLGLIGNINTS